MNFFMHYKNKPYKYVGLARHSETQEEMVVYETRYENEGGRVWVRPKNMFFESIHLNGTLTPRFKKIPLQIQQFGANLGKSADAAPNAHLPKQITDAQVEAVIAIMKDVFSKWDAEDLRARLNTHSNIHLALGFVENQVVGFKLGYAHDRVMFYSWLGGVRPAYRGLGIASDLMNCQHIWCQQNGYQSVITKTLSHNKAMILLNLKSGFEITGTENSMRGLKVIMQKNMTQQPALDL